MNRREFITALAAMGMAVILPKDDGNNWVHFCKTCEVKKGARTLSAWMLGEEIKEVGIWDVVLTDLELNQLAIGVSPRYIRNDPEGKGHLIEYWPNHGTEPVLERLATDKCQNEWHNKTPSEKTESECPDCESTYHD